MLLLLCLFVLLCNFNHGVDAKCIDHERDALLRFKGGIEFDRCKLLTTWVEKEDCCEWHGIRCSNATTNHVIAVHLQGGDHHFPCLVGKVDYSSSLIKLDHLKYLDLSSNKFNQTIHKMVDFSFTNLEYLNLSKTSLFGDLPTQLGNQSKLLHLDLSSNSLSGHVPSSFSSLKSLRVLNLSSNNFSGSIAEIMSSFCDLQILDLSNNNFTDNMSKILQTLSDKCAKTPILENLALSRNQIWGSIPETISSFSSMKELYLDHNKLNGTISQGIGQLLNLEVLSISNNSLEVTLNQNHFINLSKLHELYMSNNPKLVIKCNDSWSPPFQLDVISLRSCTLGPFFPKWLMSQTKFSYLDISNAHISGNISTSLWSEPVLSNLEYLNMSNNMIQGPLPNLSTAFRIFAIDLNSNRFEGSLHSLLGGDSDNNTEFICPKFQHNLAFLDVSNNSLSGKLHDCWMIFNQLKSLHLENNFFSGNIPSSVGSLRNLEYLHLQNNRFSGELPASFKNCRSLVILDLAYNSLTGNLSSSLHETAFENLAILNLRDNYFFGSLPSGLCQLSKLQILDVAYNQIAGTIPRCVRNLKAMRTVTGRLNDTRFSFVDRSSDRPQFYFTYIESVGLQWKGRWYKFGISLKLLMLIDLSSNHLEGEIPDEISSLIGLALLDLSRNKFTGKIPSNIGQLSSVEFLDLSRNNLFGPIPTTSFSKLYFLGILDLSNNNLSGEIQVGTRLGSFDCKYFMGNPLLHCVGPPTSETQSSNMHKNDDESSIMHKNDEEFHDEYLKCMGVGIIIGFFGVGSTIVLKKSWRRTMFRSWL